MKKLIFSILVLFVTSCNQDGIPKKTTSLELFSFPEKFNGEIVSVKGFFRFDKKNGYYLFHSKPYRTSKDFTVSFYLDETSAKEDVKLEFNNPIIFEHAVIVSGRVKFEASSRKITLVDINKIEKETLNGGKFYFDIEKND